MKPAQLGTAYYSTPLLELVTWRGFSGWQGVKCHHCGTTHNVFCGIPCILCGRCRKCITLSWFGMHEFCFDRPDYGWDRVTLNWATYYYGRYRRFLKDYEMPRRYVPVRIINYFYFVLPAKIKAWYTARQKAKMICLYCGVKMLKHSHLRSMAGNHQHVSDTGTGRICSEPRCEINHRNKWCHK